MTARQNLSATLAKALNQWEEDHQNKRDKKKTRTGTYADVDEDSTENTYTLGPNMLDEFKKQFVVLHAMLIKGSQ